MANPLESGKLYQIYNRANGDDVLFKSTENYYFFLKKYIQHIVPITETYCYCLMPNHFHFLVKIKENYELLLLDKFNLKYTEDIFLSKQFSNLFSSYTQSFNKVNNRKGSLFMRAFKRKEIKSENYLRTLVKYIHLNPVKANLCSHPEKYLFSSYKAILSSNESLISKMDVINYFESIGNFKFYHAQ